uniref:Uncharacterized protein isoform X1 n=2 Tax=Pogona vitticeps TaxID=103695 RepID=A0A6J0SC21_9SAUR
MLFVLGLRRMEKAMKQEMSAGEELEECLIRPGVLQSEHLQEPPGSGPLLSVEGRLPQGMQENWEAQWQGFLKTLQPVHTGEEHPVMEEITAPWDDTKAFLASFEKVAKSCRWPKEEWATQLLPALSGEAKKAFQDLEAQDREDYGKVKAAILRGDALRMEVRRQHFRDFSCQEVEDPRRLHSHVQELCHRWLRPERRSKEQILELLILEQFLASLPPDLQGWIRAGGPDTCSQAVALAEDFLVSQKASVEEMWQEPLKEESTDFLETEESLNVAEEEIYEEAKPSCDGGIPVPGRGTKGPSCTSSLSPERQEIIHSGVKTEPVELKEASHSLQRVKSNLPQPGHQPIIWQVLQEDEENVSPQGYMKGREVKMANSQHEGTEPKDTTMSQGPLLEADETFDEGCEPTMELEKSENKHKELSKGLKAVIHQSLEVHTVGEMPMLSKNDRKYHHKLAFDGLHAQQGHQECPGMSEEHFQKNLYSDKDQRMGKGENKSELATDGKGHILKRLLSNRKNETPNNPSSFKYMKSSKKNQGVECEGGPYGCSHCRKCFLDKGELADHHQLHAESKSQHQPELGQGEPFRETLTRGQETDTPGMPYVCCQCGKSFNQRRNLENHQRTHTGVKPYVCSQCRKCFNQRRYLKIHQRIHTGEKPYKCSECGKRFVRGQCLRNHQRTHTGDKPYACSQCGKCFNQKRYLKNHLRIHMGLKLYKCSHCGKNFSQSGALINHQKIHTERNHTDVLGVESALN